MSDLKSWQGEKQSAYLYELIAKKEVGTPYEKLFSKLGEEAESQSKIWEEKIKQQGGEIPDFEPDLRTRIVAALLKRLGPKPLGFILPAMKIRGMSAYSSTPPGHPTHTQVDQIGRRHRGTSVGGNLRAAVFGVNDGLVSNTSLILGVAGASQDHMFILLSGIAGLLAGAFSMAAGEYISVRSQREMYEHQIDLEKKELEEYPEEEAQELALIYEAKGLPYEDAKKMADKLISNPNRALDTLAKEELGLNIDELGSPLGAALSSFTAFSGGAIIPLLPFLIWKGSSSLSITIMASAVSLFGIGAVLSLFTGRRGIYSGLRMLLIGTLAGAATYLIGKFLGVTLA